MLGQLLKGCAQPFVGEDCREQAMGNVAQLHNRGAHPVFGHAEAGVQLSVAASDLAPRQPDREGDRHEALLRPVVQVALERAPFGVGGSHDTGARGAKLPQRALRVACRRSCSSARLAVVTSSDKRAGSSSRPGRWTTAITSSPRARTRVASRPCPLGRLVRRPLGVDPLAALEAVQQLQRRVAE